ncbi:ribosome-inactivating protein gelonin [Ricinus communis]|uniref:ribosome-inactivating protein gelonin n=1 Tax=Ricinus communis TaxID=3988 RepID=UPI00201AC4C4|nr:ribosome-inactivating protein gelonin [Ricinus communis]
MLVMEGKISKVWLVVATWFCWTTVCGSTRVVPLAASYPEVSFDAGSYETDKYTNFMSSLREKLKSNVVSYNIPVLPYNLPVTSDKRFALVILTSSGSTTTIALDVINAYVLGFKVGKKSYFFSDVSNEIYGSKLFSDTTKARLPYGGSYQALYNAGASRENVPLGISQFNNAIFQLVKYAGAPATTDIASNLVVVIQMISEAARFKYIEEKLVENFYEDLYPKGDLLSLENNWGTLSEAIQTSANGNFNPIRLEDEDYKPYYVSTVKAVEAKMGLLLAKESMLSIDEEILSWPYNGGLIKKFLSMF